MFLRCAKCGFTLGDDGMTHDALMKAIEEAGGTVDTTPPDGEDAIIHCPQCKNADEIEIVQ